MDKKKGLKIALKILAVIVFVAALSFFTFLFYLICDTLYEALYYGKYDFSLGVLPIIVGFISSVALFINALFGKKFRKGGAIICAVIILSAVPYVKTVDYFLSQPYRSFNTRTWIINEHFRYYMIDDLEEKYELVGMDIDEVQNLLGKGREEVENTAEGKREFLEYDIGNAMVFHNTYRVYYDSNGKGIETEIRAT